MAKKIASTFSLILLLFAVAVAADYGRLKHDLDSAPGVDAKVAVLEKFASQNPNLKQDDPELQTAIETYEADQGSADTASQLGADISLREDAQRGGAAATGAGSSARQIKNSPLYRDSGAKRANWLETALQHIKDLFSGHGPDVKAPSADLSGLAFLGPIVKFVLIGALIFAVGFVLYLFARQFEYRKSLRRKASALLEDDEPERTADEWLELADGLTSQGRYREAVRCLYLACLLRLDEAEVARFQREQTNWEHLARIESSPRKPVDLDFVVPTRAFDLIWYGHQVKGLEDVEQFRAWYTNIVSQLRKAAA